MCEAIDLLLDRFFPGLLSSPLFRGRERDWLGLMRWPALASCTSNWVMRWDDAGSIPCDAACAAAGVPMVCCAELLALPATCFL